MKVIFEEDAKPKRGRDRPRKNPGPDESTVLYETEERGCGKIQPKRKGGKSAKAGAGKMVKKASPDTVPLTVVNNEPEQAFQETNAVKFERVTRGCPKRKLDRAEGAATTSTRTPRPKRKTSSV